VGEGQCLECLMFPMATHTRRASKHRTASILDRVYLAFVLSVGEDDGLLTHDFGWTVNRVP
jgi:hypothetical protein